MLCVGVLRLLLWSLCICLLNTRYRLSSVFIYLYIGNFGRLIFYNNTNHCYLKYSSFFGRFSFNFTDKFDLLWMRIISM